MVIGDRTPARAEYVTFSGSVVPAHEGSLVSIQRKRRDGRYVVAGRTLLGPATNGRSTFSRSVRIFRSGRYRVRVQVKGTDNVSGAARSQMVRVGG
jgi:hypothetical protein